MTGKPEKEEIRGQCFLCHRVDWLVFSNEYGKQTYVCKHCGAKNLYSRVVNNINLYGRKLL